MPNLKLDTDESIIKFLPDALAKAMASYQEFSDRAYESDKAKAFKEYHDSCKAAISHVELLLKLAEKFQILDKKPSANNDLAMMIENAKKEVNEYKG